MNDPLTWLDLYFGATPTELAGDSADDTATVSARKTRVTGDPFGGAFTDQANFLTHNASQTQVYLAEALVAGEGRNVVALVRAISRVSGVITDWARWRVEMDVFKAGAGAAAIEGTAPTDSTPDTHSAGAAGWKLLMNLTGNAPRLMGTGAVSTDIRWIITWEELPAIG